MDPRTFTRHAVKNGIACYKINTIDGGRKFRVFMLPARYKDHKEGYRIFVNKTFDLSLDRVLSVKANDVQILIEEVKLMLIFT